MNVTEIAVIGAGPAGIAAAVRAAEAGAHITLIDENPRPGGQYYKQPPSLFNTQHSLPSSLAENIQHGRDLIAGLNNSKITVCPNTLVWNISPDRVLDLYAPEGGSRLQAKRIILASGAYERLVPFEGWTLPGVTTVGAAQLMLKGQGLLIGQKILVCGTGPLLSLAAAQLLDAGAQIAAIVELHSRAEFFGGGLKLFGQWGKLGQGMAQQKQLLDAGVPIKFGYTVVRALGGVFASENDETRGAVIAKVDGNGRPMAGTEETIAADTVCMNYGFVPATELARLAGCEQFFDSHFDAFATKTNDELETSVRGIFAAGEVRGIGGVEVALLEGKIAGTVAARQLGYTAATNGHDAVREWQKARAAFDALSGMFAVKPGLFASIPDDVMVCRCEEIRAGEIRDAARGGAQNLNALKAWNRCGMGRCQGRICGPIAAQIIAQEIGATVESVGTFTARVPVKPVPLAVVGAIAEPHATGTAMEDHVGYGRAVVK